MPRGVGWGGGGRWGKEYSSQYATEDKEEQNVLKGEEDFKTMEN